VARLNAPAANPPAVPPPADDSGDDDGDGDDGEVPPPSCDYVPFEKVQPILAERCVSCHFAPERLDTYTLAASWGDEIVRRINLSNGNNDRMPPPPGQPLTADQRALLEKWVEDGKQEKCVDGERTGFVDFKSAETAMLRDALKLDSEDRANTLYLLTTDLINEGKDAETLALAQQAIDKTLNSLSVREDQLFRVTKVSPGVWRVDLSDFGLDSVEKIAAIAKADPFKIISETDEGVQLRGLIGRDLTFLHARNFIDIALRQSALYYTLVEIPATLAQYQAQLGINVAEDLEDLEATFAGSSDSPISLEKNRLIVRFELENAGGQDGAYWQTFDPLALVVGQEDRNLFAFPCLKGTGCTKIFDFAASEVIVTAPNGTNIYSLWAADGTRQNAAPINVVANNKPGPRGPEIVNSVSCFQCHSAGLITMRDQVRGHVLQNAQTFLARDVEIIKELYPPANVITATFSRDMRQYAASMSAIGVDAKKPDPITVLSDEYQQSWNAKKVGAWLGLGEAEFKELLKQSAAASTQAGSLLDPQGSITFDTFVSVFPILVEDLRLFKEPLGE
jgi:hypothetical protein